MPLPARRALAKRFKTTASPSQSRQDAVTTGSRAVTPVPVPSKTMTPIPPPPKPTTPVPQKEKTPAPVTPQRVVPQHVPDLASSVPRLNLLVATPAANTSSSNIRASGSSRVNMAKPPLPKFTAPLTTQQPGPSSTTQRKVMPFDRPGAVSDSG